MSMSLFELVFKKYSQLWAGVGIVGLGLAYGLPHTIYLDKYKKSTALYPGGFEAKPDDNLKDLVQQVHDMLLWKPLQEATMRLYICYGHDPRHLGSTGMKTGTLLGLPQHYNYRSTDDINRTKIRLGPQQARVKWDSPSGVKLAESLVFSDKAKLFAIAREMKYLESMYIYTNTTYLLSFGVLSYWCGHFLNQKFQLSKRTVLPLRLGLYATITALFGVFFLTLKDASAVRLDTRVDRRTASLSDNVAVGGVEYYEKLLKRNVALRELLGDAGKSLYTPYGNTVQMLRMSSKTLTSRLNHLEQIVKDNQKREDDYRAKEGATDCQETTVVQ